MREKTPAIAAQEQLIYRELINYVELIAATRLTERPEDFMEYAKKQPAFLLIASSLAQNGQLLLSSHTLSPAALRQDHLNAIDMPVIATYGRTSVLTALLLPRIRDLAAEAIDIAEEIDQMKGGIGIA
jgi:hypothetical protein